MRRELFARGIISPKNFEAEVREKAIQSQAREGLHDPLWEETEEIWETRMSRIRTHLTDFYFAYNLRYEDFERIVKDVVAERGSRPGGTPWKGSTGYNLYLKYWGVHILLPNSHVQCSMINTGWVTRGYSHVQCSIQGGLLL